jgi:hypothetical protein
LALCKGKFLNHIGCIVLVKFVLSSLPISLLAALKVDGRTIKVFDKICHGMLWACKESASGGSARSSGLRSVVPKLLVAWESSTLASLKGL